MKLIDRIKNVWGCFDFGQAWFELTYQPPLRLIESKELAPGEIVVAAWPDTERKLWRSICDPRWPVQYGRRSTTAKEG